ncbi:sulfite exporter TauE/SafE family protein [Latilactobacillus sakei]|uniref:sulfite exporter TauE/SafE family protein n=1 Tax=Latilactobacillus sakei TaxID=1599 RepID=UPI001BD2C841|nr:sulfite exporter TauE/SafE family protein [Latilactobacillus sakei]QVQ49129.1 sulfite exporter TauE/SafE family protein [Latilactobacillus sakei subsp. sakei]USG07194.1 permease [Latilactobacillus sakei]USG10869.1 permease [Latilactobacillus sakei]
MSFIQLSLTLILIGVAAGIVSTVGGLASLVSYPALLALGLPPVTANVTNTAGLIFTGVGASLASRKELKHQKRELITLLPLTLIGCIVGALLLFKIPAETFQKIVPFFILSAGILILLPRHLQVGQPAKWQVSLAWLGVFLVGVYSGYFGAASGVLMLSLLSVISQAPFQEYNATKNLTMGLANCIATLVYALQTTIIWGLVLLIGPIIVRLLPERLTKIGIGIAALGLAVSFFIVHLIVPATIPN